jgi:hypothetical protein
VRSGGDIRVLPFRIKNHPAPHLRAMTVLRLAPADLT